jgi:iron complex transport system substrate-binding protein
MPQAEAAASEFINKINNLKESYGARPAVAVFYEIWHVPLLTVSGAHVISDVIALCGGRNVFAGLPALTPAVALEAVAAARPEALLGGGSAGGESGFTAQWRAVPLAALRALPALYVPPDEIQRPTPRLARGARTVCEHLERVRALRGDPPPAPRRATVSSRTGP